MAGGNSGLTTSTTGGVAARTSAGDVGSIPRIDVHAHCGDPRQMDLYVRISDALWKRYGRRLAAWVDLDDWAPRKVSPDEYLSISAQKYQGRFLLALHDEVQSWTPRFVRLNYTPDDLVSWKSRGIVGVKIWVQLSDCIAPPTFDPIFAKMAGIGLPGASIHIANPYPTKWCMDPILYWRAQKAWERVLDRHPRLVVVNAHMLDHFCSDEQLDYLDYMLTAYPNLHVDLAAREMQFQLMSYDKLREFLIRRADRILFGTDIGHVGSMSGTDINREEESVERVAEHYNRCFRLLETDEMVKGCFYDEDYGPDVERKGMVLPRDVLEKIYYRNAVCIYPQAGKTLRGLGYPL